MPKVGLVTILYNSDNVLEGFFKSLSLQNYTDYHLYLIDNSPSEGTTLLIDELSKKYPVANWSHIKNDENYGVAKGNNIGIELSLKDGAEYVLILNNDIEFYQPDLISKMVQCAVDGESIIVPKILYFGGRTIWMAGGRLLVNKGFTVHVGEDREDDGSFNTSGHFDYAPTCFMLIKKKVFETVGLMDEQYFVYYDDTDFVYRAVKSGYLIYYISDLEIFHKVSTSTGGNTSLFSIYYVNRNRFYFIKKNYTGINKYIALVYTIITRIVTYVKYNKLQRAKLFLAVMDSRKMK